MEHHALKAFAQLVSDFTTNDSTGHMKYLHEQAELTLDQHAETEEFLTDACIKRDDEKKEQWVIVHYPGEPLDDESEELLATVSYDRKANRLSLDLEDNLMWHDVLRVLRMMETIMRVIRDETKAN